MAFVYGRFVDINGTTALGATVDLTDEFLIHDVSANGRRKVTASEIVSAATAALTSFTPAGNTAANTVQLAIQELQTEIDAIQVEQSAENVIATTGAPTAADGNDNDFHIAMGTTGGAAIGDITGPKAGGVWPATGNQGNAFSNLGLALANPLVNGTAAVGVSTLAAREDHVHPVQPASVTPSTAPVAGTPVVTATDVDSAIAQIDTALQSTVPSTRTLTAGAGLTGGGDLTTNKTFDVVSGNAAIVVNADDITFTAAAGLGITVGAGGAELDITGLTALAAAPDAADEIAIEDVSAGVKRKVTVAELLSTVNPVVFETFALTAPTIAGGVTLSQTPSANADVAASIKGGGGMDNGGSFSVAGTALTFDAATIAVLLPGDVLSVQYTT